MTTPGSPSPIKVLGLPSAHIMAVYSSLEMLDPAPTPWFWKAVEALWQQGLRYGIDPVVLVAQSGHETGWGRFGRAVTESHGNTAGIKIRDVPKGAADDDPDIHARFAIDPVDGTPWQGALAHVHHLGLYAGRVPPRDTPDPRAKWVWPGTQGFGSVVHVRDLGTKWAPSPEYGLRVESTAAALAKPTGSP